MRDVYRHAIESDLRLAAYLGTIENGQSFGPLAGDRGVGTFGGSEDHGYSLPESGHEQFAYCPARLSVGSRCRAYVFVIASAVWSPKSWRCTGSLQSGGAAGACYCRRVAARDGERPGLPGRRASFIPDAAEALQGALREDGCGLCGKLEPAAPLLLEDGQIIDAAATALCAGDLAAFGKQVDLSQKYSGSVCKIRLMRPWSWPLRDKGAPWLLQLSGLVSEKCVGVSRGGTQTVLPEREHPGTPFHRPRKASSISRRDWNCCLCAVSATAGKTAKSIFRCYFICLVDDFYFVKIRRKVILFYTRSVALIDLNHIHELSKQQAKMGR